MAEAAGFQGEVRVLADEHAPAHLKPSGNYGQHWAVDSSRIRRELGYEEPVLLAEALRRTIEWERANPSAVSIWKVDYAAEDAAIVSSQARKTQKQGKANILGFPHVNAGRATHSEYGADPVSPRWQ